ncbi:hypothetical protein LTS18_007799, partial [Coniosporium uncinatum]
SRPELDSDCVVAWGYSPGAYYSLRLAHTHSDRLKASVVHGAFVHHAFSEEWMKITTVGEYHADLQRALEYKFGIGKDYESSASPAHPPHGYIASNTFSSLPEAQKTFSLLETGILKQGHGDCEILVMNGREDTVAPIEDSELIMQFPGPKHAHFPENKGHMCEPGATPVALQFLQRVINEAK